MAASVAAITLSEAIIPLISTLDMDELVMTKIEHRWNDAANNNAAREAKIYLPMAPNGENKELLLYVVDQFFDALDTSRLNITTGLDMFAKFRAVVNGDVRILWQSLSNL